MLHLSDSFVCDGLIHFGQLLKRGIAHAGIAVASEDLVATVVQLFRQVLQSHLPIHEDLCRYIDRQVLDLRRS